MQQNQAITHSALAGRLRHAKPWALYEVRYPRKLCRSSFSMPQRRALDDLAHTFTLYVSNGQRVWRWNRWCFSMLYEDWLDRYGHKVVSIDKL